MDYTQLSKRFVSKAGTIANSGQTACRADFGDAVSREIPYEVGLTHQSCFVAVAAVKDASHAVPQL
jgi:hypothetical protein